MSKILTTTSTLLITTIVALAGDSAHTFKKIRLTDQFWGEGAAVGDFNHDGKADIACGPFWYAGPEFKNRREFAPANATWKRKSADGSEEILPGYEGALGTHNNYSECFIVSGYDFNSDGWDDIAIVGFPGKETSWYENPKGRDGHWQRHVILSGTDNQSPGFVDVTGAGKPELLCCSGGFIGYAEADWKNPGSPWTFHAVSPKGGFQRFTHGIGAGDVNGDGRVDILEAGGWWEQPASREGDPVWVKHSFNFGDGGAQMLVYDVNGDGLNDVITSIKAHGHGLAWYEQVKEDGKITFREHVILNKDGSKNEDGITFSQLHALALADMDGDGVMDIVTGKRFWAHGKDGDAEPNSPAVVYWFRIQRLGKGEARITPNLVDNDSGVGTQVTVAKASNSSLPDVVVGNKKGLFLLQHQTNQLTAKP